MYISLVKKFYNFILNYFITENSNYQGLLKDIWRKKPNKHIHIPPASLITVAFKSYGGFCTKKMGVFQFSHK
jgi:hypothetical protein